MVKNKKEILKIVNINKDKIKKYGVKRIGVFGSFSKSRQNKKSDVDILVEFENNKKTFDNYMELKFLLEKLFGRKVDLVIKESLKSRIRPYIMKEIKYA